MHDSELSDVPRQVIWGNGTLAMLACLFLAFCACQLPLHFVRLALS